MVTPRARGRTDNPAQPVSTGRCADCGASVVRIPGGRGPLPARCDDCRERRRDRSTLISRVRESVELSKRFGLDGATLRLEAVLAELEADDAVWTRFGQ